MPSSPIILALGIAHLPMLGWLVLAAAPLLIHLWNRQQHRPMRFAAMEFLLAAVKRRARRVRLQQWLLLLVRTAVVLLLVLAVAEPYIDPAGLAAVSVDRTHRVLVIDASYSMAYRPDEGSRFDRAKQAARRIVEASRQGDALTLVLLGDPPQVVVGTPAFEPREILGEIDRLELSHATADLSATLSIVQRLVERAGQGNSELTRHEVYFFTDLDRACWQPDLSASALKQLQRRRRQLAQAASIRVLDVGQAEVDNRAVTSLHMLQPIATIGPALDLRATVRNYSDRRHSGQTVELLLDGRLADQREIDLAPGEEKVVPFSCRFEVPGEHTVEVRAAGDALEVDNHRRLVVPLRQEIRVLCIDGQPSGEPFDGAADYLVHALAPQDTTPDGLPVRPELATENALRQRDLRQFDAIFLCHVGQFTSHEAELLDAYLRQGGNLILFLGGEVAAERYNEELYDRAERQRLLPARIGPVAESSAGLLDPLEYNHPMVREFRGHERAGLTRTPVYKYIKLDIPEESSARVVLKTAEGDPLIVEEPIHRGRVVLVATSADVSWTDMPALPVYVPLVQEMLAYCLADQLNRRNVLVGQAMVDSVATSALEVPVWLQTPDGRTRTLRIEGDGEYGTFRYADTPLSGIYSARFGAPVSQTRQFAVNIDPVESDLTHLDEETFRNRVWPQAVLLTETTPEIAVQRSPAQIASGGFISVALLNVVLGLLLLETFMAWRYGTDQR